jgi:hypothetical protein
MSQMRKVIALTMSVLLLLWGSGAFALLALEVEHEHEHEVISEEYPNHHAHDAQDHAHADAAIELVSQILGQSGIDHLVTGWIVAPEFHVALLPARSVFLTIPPAPLVLAPLAPPGPPPRLMATNRGGIVAG